MLVRYIHRRGAGMIDVRPTRKDVSLRVRKAIAVVCAASAVLSATLVGDAAVAQASSSEAAAVRAALLRYTRALQAKDFTAVCATLTARTQTLLIEGAEFNSHGKKTYTCATATATLYASFRPLGGYAKLIKAIQSAPVVVHGTTATVDADGRQATLLLTAGHWLVSLKTS
jgi:hypothetical protein